MALLLTVAALASCATTPNTGDATASGTIRVVSYNIRHGRGLDDSVSLDRTAAVLRRLTPDIVALQEVDDGVQRSGATDQPAILGRLLDMQHAFGEFMPYQGGRYGMALLSRYPIVRARSLVLPTGNEPRVALVAELRLPDRSTVTVVNVHFDWVGDDGYRYAQAQRVATFLDSLTTPYILLGDFNDRPGSRTLALFTERAMEAAKPPDARMTFPSVAPDREIDFIFAAPAAAWRALEVRVIDEREASDHRPVLAVLRRVGAGTGPLSR